MRFLSEITYIVAAVLFILGLKRLSSPATARSGNLMGAIGMLLAVVATLLVEEIIGPWALVGGLVAERARCQRSVALRAGGVAGRVEPRRADPAGPPRADRRSSSGP